MNLQDLFQQLPNFTKEDLECLKKMNDAHMFEVNGTKLVTKLVPFLRHLIGEFVKWEIMHPNNGFHMNDDTFCLFKTTINKLQQVIEDPTCENYAPLLTKYAIGVLFIILGSFE